MTYRIGEIAEMAGVSIDALRYYERRGLLNAPPRTDGGLRRYSAEALERVAFIKQAQSLGLTLDEIQELLKSHRGRTACRRVHDLLLKHIAEVDARIKELRALRRTLDAHRRACEAAVETDEPACPTLKQLQSPARATL